MLNTTPVSLFTLLISCGQLVEIERSPTTTTEKADVNATAATADDDDDDIENIDLDENTDTVLLNIDNWLKVKCPKDILNIIYLCRNAMTQALQYTVNNNNINLPKELQIYIDTIAQSLTFEQQNIAPIVTSLSNINQYKDNNKSHNAYQQSSNNRDWKGAGQGKMNYYGGNDHKSKYQK